VTIAAVIATTVLGRAEWVLRLPALLFGIGTIVATWRLCRLLYGPPTAILAAAVLATSPFFVEWSRSARGYTGLALMTVVSTELFIRALRTRSRKIWVGHSATLVLAAYFHLYGVWSFALQYAAFAGVVIRAKLARIPDVLPAGAGVPDTRLRLLWMSFLAAAIVATALFAAPADDLVRTISSRGRMDVRADFPRELWTALLSTSSPALTIGASTAYRFSRVCSRPVVSDSQSQS
jgi:mannosyltransferase